MFDVTAGMVVRAIPADLLRDSLRSRFLTIR